MSTPDGFLQGVVHGYNCWGAVQALHPFGLVIMYGLAVWLTLKLIRIIQQLFG